MKNDILIFHYKMIGQTFEPNQLLCLAKCSWGIKSNARIFREGIVFPIGSLTQHNLPTLSFPLCRIKLNVLEITLLAYIDKLRMVDVVVV